MLFRNKTARAAKLPEGPGAESLRQLFFMKARFPPQTIVVAVDGSVPSWTALEAARTLASRVGGRIEAVYVEELTPAPDFEPRQQALEYKTSSEIDQGVSAALASFPAERWSFRVVKGRAPAVLARRATPSQAQLLLIGSHGRQGAERFLMGSTAEAVSHQARIPVLAIRAGQTLAPKRILVPCNLERYADDAMLHALAWARAFDAKVTALFVPTRPEWEVDADDELRRHIDEMFGSQACAEVDRLIRQGDPREEIAAEALTGRYGLVVLSGHRRAQLSDLALGSTAERLLRRCPSPMLVVPATARRKASLAKAATSALGGRL